MFVHIRLLVRFLVGFVEFFAQWEVEVGWKVDRDGRVGRGWEYQGDDHGANEHHGHKTERKFNRNDDVDGPEQHFQPDKREDNSQSGAQIAKLFDYARQQEVHRSQAENREDVRRVDNESIGRNRKNRGNRVDRENQGGDFDYYQHEQ